VKHVVHRPLEWLLHEFKAFFVDLRIDLLFREDSVYFCQVELHLKRLCLHKLVDGLTFFHTSNSGLNEGKHGQAKENHKHAKSLFLYIATCGNVTVANCGHGGCSEVDGFDIQSDGLLGSDHRSLLVFTIIFMIRFLARFFRIWDLVAICCEFINLVLSYNRFWLNYFYLQSSAIGLIIWLRACRVRIYFWIYRCLVRLRIWNSRIRLVLDVRLNFIFGSSHWCFCVVRFLLLFILWLVIFFIVQLGYNRGWRLLLIISILNMGSNIFESLQHSIWPLFVLLIMTSLSLTHSNDVFIK